MRLSNNGLPLMPQGAKQDIVGMPPRDLVLTLANPDTWVEKPLAGGSGWFRHGEQTSAKRTQALVRALQFAARGRSDGDEHLAAETLRADETDPLPYRGL